MSDYQQTRKVSGEIVSRFASMLKNLEDDCGCTNKREDNMDNPCKELYYKERDKEILQILKGALLWTEWNRKHPDTINHNYLLWQLLAERMVNNLSTDTEESND